MSVIFLVFLGVLVTHSRAQLLPIVVVIFAVVVGAVMPTPCPEGDHFRLIAVDLAIKQPSLRLTASLISDIKRQFVQAVFFLHFFLNPALHCTLPFRLGLGRIRPLITLGNKASQFFGLLFRTDDATNMWFAAVLLVAGVFPPIDGRHEHDSVLTAEWLEAFALDEYV